MVDNFDKKSYSLLDRTTPAMRRQIFSLLSLVSVGTTAFAQSAASNPSPQVMGQAAAAASQIILNEVNTSRFPVIQVFATVLKNDKPQRGLTAADFRVREDEVEQGPLQVEAKLPPLSVVIALDNSGSMKPRMTETKEAAKSFLEDLGTADSAEVIGFAQQVKILSTMSANREVAKKAVDSTVARGNTALYDALYASVDAVKGRPGRKAVVLLSDGVDDNGVGKQLSKHSLDDLIRYARQVNVPIYAIGIGTEVDAALLAGIAQSTGALSFLTPKPEDLKTLYDRIGEQLTGQYLITYNSNLPGDGSPHQVQVKYGELASSKEYQSPKLVAASPVASPSASAVVATTPVAKPTADVEDSNSAEIKLGGLSKLLNSDGITVNKGGKQYKIGKDGVSVQGRNSSSSTANPTKPSGNQSPEWIPIPNGGVIASRTALGNDTGRISLTSRFTEDEIRDFYRVQFTKMGWSVTELPGSGVLIATGDGKRVQVALSRQSSGETQIAIDYNAD
jgi:VWFA-related protein